MQEIEIKLRVANASALHLRLKHLRAREVLPRSYECNTIYDTPSGDLARRGQLIRIRIERPCKTNNARDIRHARACRAILTYKGPSFRPRNSQTTLRKQNDRARFKIRNEIEVVVESGEQMSAILHALGLRPTFRYEKFRTTYALPGIRGLKVEFDETPVGPFVELEGRPAAIDRAARLLGYTQSDYLAETYGALYIADCRCRGSKPAHMVFRQIKKSR